MVSCSGALSRASTNSFQQEARIEATAGLQISQPSPRPCLASSSSKVRSCRRDQMKELLARVGEVLAQMIVDGDAAARQLGLQICVTSEAQPPQELAALVHFLSAPMSSRRRQSPRTDRPC